MKTRASIVDAALQQISESNQLYWRSFCATLRRTKDLFLLAAMVRAVLDILNDPDMYRDLHWGQLPLTNHEVDADALRAFRACILSRQRWLLRQYYQNVEKGVYVTLFKDVHPVYQACQRTIDFISLRLDHWELRHRFVGKQYTLIGPHNGHGDNTLVVCVDVLSEHALAVRPVIKTGNDSSFHVDLACLKPLDDESLST
ncbi:MAG: hypothetical protein WAV51_00175 [Microgenomates group bacterium]